MTTTIEYSTTTKLYEVYADGQHRGSAAHYAGGDAILHAAPDAPPSEDDDAPYDPLQDMQDFLNHGMRAPDKGADEREEQDDGPSWD